MAFETFEKGSAPVATVPTVTIQKRGLFSINEAAYRLISAPEGIKFLWDAERKVVGLQPAELTDPNAYPARRMNAKKSSKTPNRSPVLVAGTLFAKFIGIDTSVARRWTPKLEDGMLTIDLNEPGQTVIANRNRSKVALDHPDDE